MYTKFTKGCDNWINFRAMKNVDGDDIRMKLYEIGEHQSTIMLIVKRRGEEVEGKHAR